MKGIPSVLCIFEHEQYPSSNVDPWCLIIEYLNENIDFFVGFGMIIEYTYKFQKMCYGTQCNSKIPYKGVIHVIPF